jgi:autotransporter-associated beta strand protein
MNKIFRLVWSVSRKCFVVASENPKARGRNSKASARNNAAASIQALAVTGALFALPSAYAQISIIAEAPGVVQSTASFSSNEIIDFNALSTGPNAGITQGVVSISGGQIATHDLYGGAPSFNGTSWSRTGNYITTDNPAFITISLSSARNYFGLWVSAINAPNVIQIYNGATLLRQYDAAELNTFLSNTQYLGNGALASEGGGFNPPEYFAFVNFYGLSSVSFDRIVLSGNGFESDNFTVGFYSSTGSGTNISLIPDIVAAGNPGGGTGINRASNIAVGIAFNNRFDGGTLLMDQANTTYASNFAITSNGATIDQNGNNSAFSGIFSDDVAGTPGSLTIANSGTGGRVTLTGVNTYSGATTINSGATLALASTGSIASSSALTNNGTFDLSSAGLTVALGGSYSQGSSGTLRMVASAPASFQLLNIGGSASLNGTLTLLASVGSYAMGRYPLINAAGVSGQFSAFSTNLSSYTSLSYQLGYSGNQVYLYLTPSVADTQQEIGQNASALRSRFNEQNAALLAGLSYDCQIFDKNNLCVSAGGRYTYAGEGSLSNLGGLVILGYRPTANTRVGLFADQSLENNSADRISQSKNDPTLGIFGNWAMNKDGNGLNLHASAVFSTSDLTVTRSGSALTEGGNGKSSFDGQAYELRASYVKPLNDSLTLSPYVGLRYSRITLGAYTESANSQVASPVSYNSVTQDMSSVIVGANLSLRVTEKIMSMASLGVQQSLNYKMSAYSGSSNIPGLTTFSEPMAGNSDTLAMASATVSYDISRKERLAVSAFWQEQPSFHKGTTSIVANWTMGF